MSRRVFSRPRTKVYDCNYYHGEGYYRPTLESLDRRSGRPETLEPLAVPPMSTSAGILGERSPRPVSVGDLEALVEASARADLEEERAATLRRSRAARVAALPTPEESFESTFHARREQVKKRFSEKMLDSVGLNGSLGEEESSSRSLRRRVRREITEEQQVPLTWSLMSPAPPQPEESAAKARAQRSRARLADLEAEMEELEERGAARERRVDSLRRLLNEESSAASSLSLSSKQISVTKEKRALAF